MRKHLCSLLILLAFLFFGNIAKAQLVGDNIFLHGHWLEIGLAPNGSMGATRAAPATYHPHAGTTISAYDPATCTNASSASLLASVYDWGHDGWTTGTPAYMGDYTLPGGPWEGWGVQVAGIANYAYFTHYQSAATGCNGYVNAAGASTTATGGSFLSYTNVPAGRLCGNWSGYTASGSLTMRKEYRVDTESNALIVTAIFKNTTGAALTGIYYMRSLDPDNNETWTGGGFATTNTINYQNDYYHRVMVSATANGVATATGTPASKISLATKDCRAKALIYTSWPMSTSTNLASLWAGTATTIGTSYYAQGATVSSDIAIGLVYNIGDIAAFDSTMISYAYVYDGIPGIDSAFPEPQMVVNGVAYDSVDTVTICSTSTLPVNLIHANDKNWSHGRWIWSPSSGLTIDTGVSSSVIGSALTGTTTFTITGTNPFMGNCVTRTFYLTVIPVSSPAPVVRDTTYCLGVTPDPLTATGTGLLWYTSATGGVGSPVAPVAATGVLGVFNYYVSQTVSGCESPRSVIHVTIAPPPSITLSNNGPLCPGDALVITLIDTLPPSATITYSWTGPGGFTAVTHDVNIPSVVYADSGVYTVIVDNNGCATYPTSNTVVVHSTPLSPVIVNPTYCQFTTAVPLTATGSNLLWYTAATGGVGSATAPTPSTLVAGIFTFYVTQTVNGCESLRYPVTVTINARPPAPTIVNNPGAYCPGQPFNTYTIILGTGVLWYTAATGGVGSATPPVVNTNIPGTYTYWASQTILGCEGDRAPVTVTVYDNVLAGFTYTKHYGCHGDTIDFNNTSSGAINYAWDFGDGTSSIALNPTHIYANQGVYTVKLFAHSATCVDSMIQTINLVHLDSAAFSLSPGIVCQNLPVTFTNSSVANLAVGTPPIYSWTFGDGATSNLSAPVHSYVNTGVYNISLIVTDFVPCMDTAYATVIVDSQSSIAMQISDTTLCRGTYVTVSADFSNLGLTDLVWDFGNGDSIKNVNPLLYAYPQTGTYTISVSSRYRVCPAATTSQVVSVIPQPQLDLGPDGLLCEGSTSIVLTDAYNIATPGATWLWSTGETTPSITAASSGLYYVTVHIGGCTASDSVRMANDCYVAIPTGFSPNGDGLNDYFNPRDYFTKGIKTFNMTIYNRWGQIIFETSNIAGRGWDGTFNGVQQPQEVYIYSVKASFIDGQKIDHTGNITLIR